MTPHAPLRRSCRLSRQPFLPIHAVGWGLIGFSGLGLRGLTARSVEYPFLFVQRMSLSAPDLAICDDSGLRSCIIQEVYCASYHAVLGAACCACTGPGQRSIQFTDVRAWSRAQKSPKTGALCCSEADGIYAEEDIRRGQYGTRWPGHDWQPVPEDVVIQKGNPHGAPVVRWYSKGGKPRSVVTPWAAALNSSPRVSAFRAE